MKQRKTSNKWKFHQKKTKTQNYKDNTNPRETLPYLGEEGQKVTI